MKNRPFIAAIDNIDAKVNTPDGKDSFHALAGTIFQQGVLPAETREYAADPLELDDKPVERLNDVPKTGVDLIECPVIGNPKPKISPHYPEFQYFQLQDKVMESSRHDTAWLVVRYFNRKPLNENAVPDHEVPDQFTIADVGDQSEAIVQATETSNHSAPSDKDVLTQNIPVWAAYNSLLTSTNTTKHELSLDAVHALPLINSPTHEWKTLVTSLMQLHKLNVLTRGPDSTRPVDSISWSIPHCPVCTTMSRPNC